MKVRITKTDGDYTKGEVVDVTPNVAHGLIERGIARVDKMMTTENYRIGKNGNPK